MKKKGKLKYMKTKLPSISKYGEQMPPFRLTKEEKNKFLEGRRRLGKPMAQIIREAVIDVYLPMMYAKLEKREKEG